MAVVPALKPFRTVRFCSARPNTKAQERDSYAPHPTTRCADTLAPDSAPGGGRAGGGTGALVQARASAGRCTRCPWRWRRRPRPAGRAAPPAHMAHKQAEDSVPRSGGGTSEGWQQLPRCSRQEPTVVHSRRLALSEVTVSASTHTAAAPPVAGHIWPPAQGSAQEHASRAQVAPARLAGR